ncbi:hypothetical protein Q9R19_07570 [Microbacterium sp. ARD32]|uniref:hypothetical protein n=1 Tax=Microbacterium sp. ARD32 TaxID=2962577 RepID=UPI002881B638|nr:hypothetical protein [Microbacterium sp. ARD32]MDT0157476.1 hypothetical protein [Microbacterium sp. ARD32]
MSAAGTSIRRVGRALRETLLTLAAAGGVICIVLTILAFTGGFSLMMFRTGSMSPTIPAGSVALVQRIPASGIEIGDVVTVDRAGMLPITHRVTSVSAGPSPDARTITMKGDANEVADPEPYTITEGRIVRGSVPNLAYVIVWFGNPWVLGALTIAAALLVSWAFWPREGRSGPDAEPETQETADAVEDAADEEPTTRAELRRRRTAGVLAIGLLVGAAGALTPAPPASAAGILSIRSSLQDGATYHLDAHTPFFWDLDVDASAAPDDGELTVELSGEAPAEMQVVAEVRGCRAAWTEQGCPAGEQVLRTADALRMDGTATLVQRRPTPSIAHLRIALTAAVDGVPSATATFGVHALAEQDAAQQQIGADAGLARTGGASQAFLAAPAAVLMGLGIAFIAQAPPEGGTMRHRMLAAGVGVLCVTAALIGPAHPVPTEGAWASGQVAKTAISAAQLTAPTITSCTVSTVSVLGIGLVFKDVTVKWKSPYETSNQRVYFGTALGTKAPTRTGPVEGVYTYSVTYDSDLLRSLVSNLLGSSTPIRVQAQYGADWVSPAATKTLKIALLGLSPSCT